MYLKKLLLFMAICNHLSLGAIIFEFVVIADNGIIYCNPFGDNQGILTIDTNTDPVTELDTNLSDWDSHAELSMNAFTSCHTLPIINILKLDTSNNDDGM